MTPGPRLIWAQARGGVIGADGDMPWHLPEDLAHFREVTHGAPVIMGRRTWESLPPRFRPLPGRRNIVCTRDAGWSAAGAETAASLDAALVLSGADAWVMGGGQVYAAALPRATECVVTEIDAAVPGDTYAPVLDDSWVAETGPWHESTNGRVTGGDTPVRYRFVRWTRGSVDG